MDSATITGICPQCRKTVQVPRELSQFSCVYCGARLKQGELLSEPSTPPAVATPEVAQAAFALLDSRLLSCVTGNLGVFKKLTKSGFPSYFNGFLEQERSLLESIPAAAQAAPDALERIAEQFAANIDSWSREHKKALTSAEAMRDDAKYTLCLLLIPAIRSLNMSEGETLCRHLQESWIRRFPKSPFQLTTYENIMAGFRRRWCFITTAVCRQAGKPDDCPELTAFRAFRDEYLLNHPDGEALIRQYYEIAPAIVLAIELTDDPDIAYPAIWDKHLSPCYHALNRGDRETCKTLYTHMVHDLSAKYLRS